MHMLSNPPITVLAVTIAIRDSLVPPGLTIALVVVCIAIVGVAVRGKLRRGQTR
jgi:hypothetical protein